MTQHTLFVCQSCSAVLDHESADDRAEGNQLLQQLQAAQSHEMACRDLNIQAVGCLWTCDRPCAVTFVCPGKYTYHFVDLSLETATSGLLQFGKLYQHSENGYVLPARLPEILRENLLVRIPPIPDS